LEDGSSKCEPLAEVRQFGALSFPKYDEECDAGDEKQDLKIGGRSFSEQRNTILTDLAKKLSRLKNTLTWS
jgi:hypothetical protein